MKPKTIKTFYWVVTALFALAVLQSGIVELMYTEGSIKVMELLGYPHYLLTILGIAKILGAITVIQPVYKTIKEWAYAGFTIDFIGAMASGIYATDSTAMIIVPMIFLAVMLLSYLLWKKVESLPSVNSTL